MLIYWRWGKMQIGMYSSLQYNGNGIFNIPVDVATVRNDWFGN